MKRICVGLVGPTDHFEYAVRNHIEYLYESLHNQHVEVAISTTPRENFQEICAALQPSFIDTISTSVPESQATILEYCQGENFDTCILLRFDVLLERHYNTFAILNRGIYFPSMREDGGVDDGFYVIHRDMYTRAIEGFRAVFTKMISYQYLSKFFHSDDVRFMGIPGTVCVYQKDAHDPNVNPLLVT